MKIDAYDKSSFFRIMDQWSAVDSEEEIHSLPEERPGKG